MQVARRREAHEDGEEGRESKKLQCFRKMPTCRCGKEEVWVSDVWEVWQSYRVHGEPEDGGSGPSRSSSRHSLEVGDVIGPPEPLDQFVVSVESEKVERFEWRCPSEIQKIALPKTRNAFEE